MKGWTHIGNNALPIRGVVLKLHHNVIVDNLFFEDSFLKRLKLKTRHCTSYPHFTQAGVVVIHDAPGVGATPP